MPPIFDPAYQSDSVDGKIVAALERIYESFRTMLWQESRESGLSPIQMQILIFLRYHHESLCSVSQLAREFSMTKATISDSIRSLEAKGLLGKEQSPTDKRGALLVLSAEGEKTAARVAHFADGLQAPLAHLPDNRKADFLRDLLSIISSLQHQGIITVQRMCFNCRHFQKNHKGFAQYCGLLEQELQDADLRLDCPEHEQR